MGTALALLRRHAAKVVVSVVLGAAFVWMLHRGGLPIVPNREALAQVRWWAVPVYGALLSSTFLLRTYRWTHLVRPLADVPTRRVIGVGLVGISAILFAPLRIGEIVRPWMLSARTSISFAQAAGTVGAERVIDGLVLSLVLLAGLVWSTPISPMPAHVALVRMSAWAALAVFTSAFVAMAAFYSFRERARRVTHALVSVVSERAALWVTTQVERVADGLRFLPSSRHAAPYLRDTLLYWASNVLGMWALLRGCGVAASFAEACVTMGVLGVGILLPAGPGFFGAFQASVYAALAMFFSHEVVREAGAAYVFVLYATQLAFSLCVIPLGLWLARPDAATENLAPAPPLRNCSTHAASLDPPPRARRRATRCGRRDAAHRFCVGQGVVRFAVLARADVQHLAAVRPRRPRDENHREGSAGRVRALRIQEQRDGRSRVGGGGRDRSCRRQGEGRRPARAAPALPRASARRRAGEEASRRVRRAREEGSSAAAAIRRGRRRRASQPEFSART